MAAVQWVHGSSKANQLPEITNLWSDSAINCSVNGFMALQKPKSYGFEQLVAVTCPLRAVEMVSGPWRCDEQLLWHLFALGSSCLAWGVPMQVWGLVPLVLSCWLDRLWSLPSSFGWSRVFGDVTSGFFGISLP
jgi:hypothetical protein